MAVYRLKVVGPLINPTIQDADTGELLLCFTRVELSVGSQKHGGELRLTVDLQDLDLSEWGISTIEQALGIETIVQAVQQLKSAGTPT